MNILRASEDSQIEINCWREGRWRRDKKNPTLCIFLLYVWHIYQWRGLFPKILLFLLDTAWSLEPAAASEMKVRWKANDPNPFKSLAQAELQSRRYTSLPSARDRHQDMFLLYYFYWKMLPGGGKQWWWLETMSAGNFKSVYDMQVSDCYSPALIYLPWKFSCKLVLSWGYRKRSDWSCWRDPTEFV